MLPPTVIGFYLLIAFGPSGPGGTLAGLWGARTLAFSFEGLVIGSVLYSLPFMVQPIARRLRGASARTRSKPPQRSAPTGARPSSASPPRWPAPASSPALILTFAHTVGEFGVVLMIGGNIPGETKVLSIAIYDFVERGEWMKAHWLSLGHGDLRLRGGEFHAGGSTVRAADGVAVMLPFPSPAWGG